MMPRVTVTAYEYENGLLPMVCAKCGQPADVRVPRKARFLGEDAGVFAVVVGIGVVFGILFCPPLFLFIAMRVASVIEVPVPMCELHRSHWKWRDRVTVGLIIPLWTLGVLGLDVVAVIYLLKLDSDSLVFALTAAIGVLVLTLTLGTAVNWGTVIVAKPRRELDARLSGVHPDFEAALAEDRARQRVDDPERRTHPRGVRDDFDDELG